VNSATKDDPRVEGGGGMTAGQYLNILKSRAEEYRLDAHESITRNSHLTGVPEARVRQKDVDAILVDFINFVGSRMGVDYALAAKDFKK
jgi:hypothetical protein